MLVARLLAGWLVGGLWPGSAVDACVMIERLTVARLSAASSLQAAPSASHRSRNRARWAASRCLASTRQSINGARCDAGSQRMETVYVAVEWQNSQRRRCPMSLLCGKRQAWPVRGDAMTGRGAVDYGVSY